MALGWKDYLSIGIEFQFTCLGTLSQAHELRGKGDKGRSIESMILIILWMKNDLGE